MRKGLTYLAIGDSWTWAKNTTTTLGTHFYATKVRNALRISKGMAKLINKGIGGVQSSGIVKNIPWITEVEADVITIGVGTNDCVNGAVSQATYQANLEKIVDALKLRNPSAQIILCTPGQTLDPTRSPYVQAYRDTMIQVATNKGVSLCRFDQAWLSSDNSTYLESDNIHPNVAGQQKLFDILYPIINLAAL